MLVKTSDLIGPALDLLVSRAGADGGPDGWGWFERDGSGYLFDPLNERRYSPSTDPAQAYPIIEREKISTVRCNDLYFPKGNERGDYYEQYWRAKSINSEGWPRQTYGPTPLIAAMRAYVASRIGDEVEVPDELMEKPR